MNGIERKNQFAAYYLYKVWDKHRDFIAQSHGGKRLVLWMDDCGWYEAENDNSLFGSWMWKYGAWND